MEESLRFLGILITDEGAFAPWRDSFDSQIHTLTNRLRNVGISSNALALLRGMKLTVFPSLLFGCEIWGINWIYRVMFKKASVYHCDFMTPITNTFARLAGVSRTYAKPLLYRLYNIPTFADLVIPRLYKLLKLLSSR